MSAAAWRRAADAAPTAIPVRRFDLRGDGDAKKQRRHPPIGSNPHNGGHGQTEWDSASGVHGGIKARSFDAARAATYTRAAIVTASPAAQASVRITVSADTTAHARAAATGQGPTLIAAPFQCLRANQREDAEYGRPQRDQGVCGTQP